MKLLIAGSRDWSDYDLVHSAIAALTDYDYTTIVHGGCRGADLIAAAAAKKLGLSVLAYPADWSIGRKAGPLRNQRMLDENQDIRLAILFHDDIEHSRGTKDMLDRCIARGVKVRLVTHGRPSGSWIY